MLWYACMIHENRDLATRDVKMLIRAAAVAFTSENVLLRPIIPHLCSFFLGISCHAGALLLSA